jgi:photoactive yellow protein
VDSLRAAPAVEDSIYELSVDEIDRYPVGVITVDRQGVILRYNHAESAFARRSPLEVIGRRFFEDVAPCAAVRDFKGRFEEFAEHRDSGAERFDFTFQFAWGKQDVGVTLLRRADHEEILIIVRVRSMRRPAAAELLSRDDLTLRAPETDAPPLGDLPQLGHWIDDHANAHAFWSTEMYEILGVERAGHTPRVGGFLDYVHPEDRRRVQAALTDARETLRPYAVEHRVLTSDGNAKLVQLQGQFYAGGDGAPPRLVGTLVDLSQRRSNAARWWRSAHFDPLTKLPNRTLFMQRLDGAVAAGTPFAVLFLDLDRFKLVNDTAGHAVGDQLLRLVASRLTSCVTSRDTLARLNGDEFVAILADVPTVEHAIETAESMIRVMAQPFIIDDHQHFVTTSIGIARWPADGHDAESLLQAADLAMYYSKGGGANTFLVYDSAIREGTMRSALRENELRAAATGGQFVLAYQPIFTIDGRLDAVEALIRWNHPTQGELPPSEFIPLAEKSGLIAPIGQWALRTACAQMRTWREAGTPVPRMTVNVSAPQLKARRFADFVAGLLREFEIEPSALELEITENVIVDGFDDTMAALADLKLLGVRLSIDDFGTGYSALSYLKYLPVDTLKLDRAFVVGLGTESLDDAIASTIVSLAHNLKLDVIAEGVETEVQLEALRGLNCSHVQGFLLGQPMPPAQIATVRSF